MQAFGQSRDANDYVASVVNYASVPFYDLDVKALRCGVSTTAVWVG